MSNDEQPFYRRILLKLSGEALQGDSKFGIDPKVLNRIAEEIHEVVNLGVEVGVVIGGGNLFRGAALSAAGLGRVTGDYMGMLATMMNALALRDQLEQIGLEARIMSAIPMSGIVDHYHQRKVITHLQQKRVVLLAAGTGNPFFTTDSAASLRGIEIEADIVIKATKVDGVYSADPVKNPDAVFYPHLSFDRVIKNNLAVMDSTAVCLCRDYNMPIKVFNMTEPHMLKAVVMGENVGTLVDANE